MKRKERQQRSRYRLGTFFGNVVAFERVEVVQRSTLCLRTTCCIIWDYRDW